MTIDDPHSSALTPTGNSDSVDTSASNSKESVLKTLEKYMDSAVKAIESAREVVRSAYVAITNIIPKLREFFAALKGFVDKLIHKIEGIREDFKHDRTIQEIKEFAESLSGMSFDKFIDGLIRAKDDKGDQLPYAGRGLLCRLRANIEYIETGDASLVA